MSCTLLKSRDHKVFRNLPVFWVFDQTAKMVSYFSIIVRTVNHQQTKFRRSCLHWSGHTLAFDCSYSLRDYRATVCSSSRFGMSNLFISLDSFYNILNPKNDISLFRSLWWLATPFAVSYNRQFTKVLLISRVIRTLLICHPVELGE